LKKIRIKELLTPGIRKIRVREYSLWVSEKIKKIKEPLALGIRKNQNQGTTGSGY
jgi:hypothetical protein